MKYQTYSIKLSKKNPKNAKFKEITNEIKAYTGKYKIIEFNNNTVFHTIDNNIITNNLNTYILQDTPNRIMEIINEIFSLPTHFLGNMGDYIIQISKLNMNFDDRAINALIEEVKPKMTQLMMIGLDYEESVINEAFGYINFRALFDTLLRISINNEYVVTKFYKGDKYLVFSIDNDKVESCDKHINEVFKGKDYNFQINILNKADIELYYPKFKHLDLLNSPRKGLSRFLDFVIIETTFFK